MTAETMQDVNPAFASPSTALPSAARKPAPASAGVTAPADRAGPGLATANAALAAARTTAAPSDRAVPQRVWRVWLFMLAVTLHNLPEGMAIGVAYAGIDLDKAATVATAIAIQDVPEGLVVAMAFRSIGYRRLQAAWLGVLSGLIEPVGAVAGAALVQHSETLLPLGLAAAAGAMLFVIVNDVVPETHAHGNGRLASCALAVGFATMMVLDTALA